MKTLISGASGLIGSALVKSLCDSGHDVIRLVRRPPGHLLGPGEVRWDPAGGQLDSAALEGFDAVVHLAGESVQNRWTARKRARIRDSRIQGTRLLSQTLARLDQPPRMLVSASGIGYYGDSGQQELDEGSPAGSGFLAAVCRDWETATTPAAEADIRVLRLRIGIVLATQGGALAKMLPLFRLGLGGRYGNGRQWLSWIALDDAVGAIGHLIRSETLYGPVNLVAPQPVTNREFAAILARQLKRPMLLPLPAFALRIGLGQMARETLLASARVLPRRLIETGYRFRHEDLEAALRHVLAP